MNKIDLIDRNSGLEYTMSSIESFCMEVLSQMNIRDWEFTILFSDDEYIAGLNTIYRHKEGPTDVLTFCENSNSEEWVGKNDKSSFYAGDIVISVEMLKKNSAYFNVDIEEELKRLIIHGILHLNGMNHETNNADEEMLVMQENILSRFGEYIF